MVGGKQEHAPCEMFLHQQILFLCRLYIHMTVAQVGLMCVPSLVLGIIPGQLVITIATTLRLLLVADSSSK